MSSTSSKTPEFNKWREDALKVDLADFIKSHRTSNLKKSGNEWVGPCPRCGGDDRFSINPRDKVFNCRGFGGGDYIAAIMHIDDCNFLEACEILSGYRPAELDKQRRSEPRTKSRDEAPPERDDRPDDDGPPPPPPPPEQDGPPAGQSSAPKWARIWEEARPLMGTLGEAYFAERGLEPNEEWLNDIRFHPQLVYSGYPSADADTLESLGRFPAVVSAIRNSTGGIIGLHRCYLEPDQPTKLAARGDPRRNKAKKIIGEMKGGAIWLYPPAATVVIAEGYENARAGELIGIGPDTASYCAAVSLGNLSGSSLESIPHPDFPKRKIGNGQPDPDRGGVILPPIVSEVIILGDGDSDHAATTASLLAAGRRFRDQGRAVFYANAPRGQDWNDVRKQMLVAQ